LEKELEIKRKKQDLAKEGARNRARVGLMVKQMQKKKEATYQRFN